MGKSKRKYYVSDNGGIRALKEKSFLVFWNDEKLKQSVSKSKGPYTDYKEAEKIMINNLINGVCSWIVSYNG